MKIKLDENLPNSLAAMLTQLGHDTDTVPDEGLAGSDDAKVWEATQNTGRFLITQDLDFSDVRRFKPGTHHGILLVRLRVPGREALKKRIKHFFETESVDKWRTCFVVITDHKIRVRQP